MCLAYRRRKRRAVDFDLLRGSVLPHPPTITAYPLALAHRRSGPHRRRDPAGVPPYRGNTLVAPAGTAYGPRCEDCPRDDGQFPRGQALPAEHLLDQASVLVQIGLLDPALVPGGFRATGKTREGREDVEILPVVGAEGVERILNG